MMRNFRPRLSYRPSIGLAIEPNQVAMSVVAATARGRREIARDVQGILGEPLQAVLERMLAPWLPPKRPRGQQPGPWVQVGINEGRVFQAIIPVSASNRLATAQTYFLEAVQSTNLRAEDRIIDMIRLEVNKQPLACLSACPRSVVTELAGAFDRMGVRLALVEPAPMGLVRAASRIALTPRKSRISQRFFLGKKQAIGVQIAGSQPLFWHSFDLTPGDEGSSILAAYSTLWMLGRHARISSPIDHVFVHGRPDLMRTIDLADFHKRTGAPLVHCEGPELDLAHAAYGVALNHPLTEPSGHNLAREFRPPVPIHDIFPWVEVALQGAIIGGVSLFLGGAAADVETKHRRAKTEIAAFSWLKDEDQGKLDNEKKRLEERLKVLESYQKTRMSWTGQLRTIAEDTPDATVITALNGTDEVEVAGKAGGKPKKQLVVNFSTPLSPNGSVPPEVDVFISSLREEPAILRHFPRIEVSGLQSTSSFGSDSGRNVIYSVVCLPHAEAPSSKGAKPR